MPRFLNPVLGAIDRLFRIDGAVKTVSRIDLENPIQPVLDVSRYAERGLGQYLGLVRYDGSHVHGAANAQKSVVNIAANILQPLGFIPAGGPSGPGQPSPDSDFWVWLMGTAMRTSSAANFSWGAIARESQSAAVYPVLGTAGDQAESLFQWSKVSEQAGYTGVGTVYPVMPDTYNQLRIYPVPLYPGDVLAIRSTTTGAATITWAMYLWIGRAGTGPPGFA